MKKKNLLILVALLLVTVLALAACTTPTQEGEKAITVEVVHADGKTNTYTYHTDELYLDKVLIAEKLIAADNIDNGMFDTVEGETAAWDPDQAYWAFYVNGEYASVGICDTPVEDGAVYRLVYTISDY